MLCIKSSTLFVICEAPSRLENVNVKAAAPSKVQLVFHMLLGAPAFRAQPLQLKALLQSALLLRLPVGRQLANVDVVISKELLPLVLLHPLAPVHYVVARLFGRRSGGRWRVFDDHEAAQEGGQVEGEVGERGGGIALLQSGVRLGGQVENARRERSGAADGPIGTAGGGGCGL